MKNEIDETENRYKVKDIELSKGKNEDIQILNKRTALITNSSGENEKVIIDIDNKKQLKYENI